MQYIVLIFFHIIFYLVVFLSFTRMKFFGFFLEKWKRGMNQYAGTIKKGELPVHLPDGSTR